MLVDLQKEKPSRALAAHKDPESKKVLQDGLDIEYKIVFDKWHTRCGNLEANQTTAYSMIFDQYCTTIMALSRYAGTVECTWDRNGITPLSNS